MDGEMAALRAAYVEFVKRTACKLDYKDDMIYMPESNHIALCKDLINGVTQELYIRRVYVDNVEYSHFSVFKLTTDIYPASVGAPHNGPCVWFWDVPIFIAPMPKLTFYSSYLKATWSPGDEKPAYIGRGITRPIDTLF